MSLAFGAFSGVPYKATALNNNNIFMTYFSQYSMAAMNMFEWENLPVTCNAEFLEECLYYSGQAIFVNHAEYGYLNLKTTVIKKDYYNRPVEFNCYGANGGPYMNSSIDDSVFIKNNKMCIPTAWVVDSYCRRLYEIQSTIDVNMNAQKTPILILCHNEKDKHTLQNVYRQYQGNRPVIYADNSRGIDEAITAVKTDAPYIIDKLYTYKQQIEHELMTFLGIKNNEIIDKKERLNLDEVNANNEITNMGGDTLFTKRQEAVEAINKMFNLKVGVKYRISEREEAVDGDERSVENDLSDE